MTHIVYQQPLTCTNKHPLYPTQDYLRSLKKETARKGQSRTGRYSDNFLHTKTFEDRKIEEIEKETTIHIQEI
jgi:hypothetical protein